MLSLSLSYEGFDFEMKRTVAISLLALTLGLGLAGCTTPPLATDASASATPSGTPVGDNSAAGAKKMMDSFLAQMEAELPAFRSKITETMSEDEAVALFEESFPRTLGYVKEGTLTPLESYELASKFAHFFLMQKNTEIGSEPSDYVLNGNTATIRSNQFEVWFGGRAEDSRPSESNETGELTLSFEDGRWIISGFDSSVYQPK